MWFLFQIAIMTLIIGSNGVYHWAAALLWRFSPLSRPVGYQSDSSNRGDNNQADVG